MNVKRCLCFLPLVVLAAFPARAAQPGDASNGSSPAQEQTFTRTQATSIIGTARKIVAPLGIEELLEIPIGGTKQWISVRGRDRGNPVLLMIHGGPASPEMPSSWFFQNSWEDYFTVVQWDQRGSGKSYNANDPKTIQPTISAERMIDDAGPLRRYLRVPSHAWATYRSLKKYLNDDANFDVIFVPTLLVHHLLGWTWLIKRVLKQKRCRVLLFFPNTPVQLNLKTGEPAWESSPTAKLFCRLIRSMASESSSIKLTWGKVLSQTFAKPIQSSGRMVFRVGCAGLLVDVGGLSDSPSAGRFAIDG